MKSRTFLFNALFFAAAFVATERFCHKQTKGFRPHKIVSSFASRPEWEIEPLTSEENEQLTSLYSKTFTYLGDGGQCYSFLSEDKTYVLKVFKLHHMRTPSWIKILPLPSFLDAIRKKFIAQRDEKLKATFTSCKIAYEMLKEETGLLYLHLNNTDTLRTSLTIKDKLAIAHRIDLDHTPFAIQKAASLEFAHLKKLMRRQDTEPLKKKISSLILLISAECKKGVYDSDMGLKRNYGIVNGTPMEIDIGSFTLDPSLKEKKHMKEELYRKTRRIFKGLKKHCPSLLSFYHETVEEACEGDDESA